MCRWTLSPPTESFTSTVEDVLHNRRELQIALGDTGHDRTDNKYNNKYQYEIRAFVHGFK